MRQSHTSFQENFRKYFSHSENFFVDLKFFYNFAIADRIAEAPVWGLAERDVVKIHKKAFIRADS